MGYQLKVTFFLPHSHGMNDDPKAVGDRISLGWMIDESPPTDFFLFFSQAEKLIFWKFWDIFLTYVMTFHLINTYMAMDQYL